MKKILVDLGIEPITIHGLRHTHACVLLYKKISIYYVCERLGHKDIETTHNIMHTLHRNYMQKNLSRQRLYSLSCSLLRIIHHFYAYLNFRYAFFIFNTDK
ncbi:MULTISPECIES: tyrosine-type recombinase/integrase [unclassified Lysinibacillus]|uniref:tyrosine-type recombinase/integrase n=1 Tax=unclassified Lysinibacillus TaxID=2636778 RepID=UPI00351418BB